MPSTTNSDGERLVKMETQVEYIMKEIESLHKKIDKFIDSADKKYAPKEDVDALRQQITDLRKDTKEDIKTIQKTIFDLVKEWGPFIGVAALVLMKVIGI